MLGSLVLDLKGMRSIMFQLSGFYYKSNSILVLLQRKLWYDCDGEQALCSPDGSRPSSSPGRQL